MFIPPAAWIYTGEERGKKVFLKRGRREGVGDWVPRRFHPPYPPCRKERGETGFPCLPRSCLGGEEKKGGKNTRGRESTKLVFAQKRFCLVDRDGKGRREITWGGKGKTAGPDAADVISLRIEEGNSGGGPCRTRGKGGQENRIVFFDKGQPIKGEGSAPHWRVI